MIWWFVKHFVNYIDQYLSHYSLHLIAAVNEKSWKVTLAL